MAAKPPLHVYLRDVCVADLLAMKPWDLRCRYTSAALETWPLNTALLSCSLPTRTGKASANPFLRGLLPEGAHLTEVALLANVPSSYTYDLLARFGRDIAGALTITVDDNPGTQRWALEPLSADGLIELVHSVGSAGLGIDEDSELSLAGVQNKMLLTLDASGGWARPLFGHPSTHIFKLDDPTRPGLVEAECECLALATRVGLIASSATIQNFDGTTCLIVERYDRFRSADGQIERVHQEDACQALGIDIDRHRGRGKYETNGGPSFAMVAQLFDRFSTDPMREKLALLDLAIFTAAIGNADLHGKNISLLHTADGLIRLAPIYDCVPTALWPRLRSTSAMSVNGKFASVASVSDLIAEARHWNIAPRRAVDQIESLLDRIGSGVDGVASTELAELIRARVAQMKLPAP
jgi:serine/threonine-protein kinase HipA